MLRRPALVQVTDTPWQPEGHLIEAASRRWDLMCAANEHLFDGTLLQVTGVHRNGYAGAVIHARPCAFRWYAVQADGPDCGCRPLGVKGLVRRGDTMLMGRRANWTTFHGGLWEFAPSGGVEPGQSPEQAIARELQEETGLTSVHPPRARAVLFDDTAMSWEVLMELSVDEAFQVRQGEEYTQLRWCAANDLPGPMTPVARQMVMLAG
ncbi:MAG: NUDIX domain-containing protein [Phycisphaerales bacterium]|nr:NUDIX domain-containing protein [Phycisphaerales bacterium]